MVRIDRVFPRSPAANGGVKTGDRLIKIGKRAVKGMKSAYEAVATIKAGDAVEMVVSREGDEITLALPAGEGL